MQKIWKVSSAISWFTQQLNSKNHTRRYLNSSRNDFFLLRNWNLSEPDLKKNGQSFKGTSELRTFHSCSLHTINRIIKITIILIFLAVNRGNGEGEGKRKLLFSSSVDLNSMSWASFRLLYSFPSKTNQEKLVILVPLILRFVLATFASPTTYLSFHFFV